MKIIFSNGAEITLDDLAETLKVGESISFKRKVKKTVFRGKIDFSNCNTDPQPNNH